MNQVNAFLHKSFQSFVSGILLPLSVVSYELAKCAKAETYVEILGSHADTLHGWIKRGYEEDYKAAFQATVLRAMKKIGCSYAKIAIDITTEPFYGDSSGLFLFNVKGESWTAEFHFIVVIANDTIFYTILSFAY